MSNKKSLSINIDIEVDGEFILCKTGQLTRTIIGTSDIDRWDIEIDEKTDCYKIPISSLIKRKEQLIKSKNAIESHLETINQILDKIRAK